MKLITFSVELKIFRQAKVISRYSIIALEDSFYIFGGQVTLRSWTGTKTVASFSTITKEWKKLGNLKEARLEHEVFVHQGEFVIVGGDFEWGEADEMTTERCELNNDEIRCKAIEPKLFNVNNPVMMSVPHDYCQN